MRRAPLLFLSLISLGFSASCTETEPPPTTSLLVNTTELVFEEGGKGTVTVSLANPIFTTFTAPVRLEQVQAGVTVDQPTLVFSPSQRSAELTVAATVDLGTEERRNTLLIGSGFDIIRVPVRITESQGVVISRPGVPLPPIQEGGSLQMLVNLTHPLKEPGRLQIQAAGSIGVYLEISPRVVLFNESNWKTPQLVTLQAGTHVMDYTLNGQLMLVLDGVGQVTLPVSIETQKKQNLIVNPGDQRLPEGGRGAVRVRLAYQPQEAVTLEATSSDPARLALRNSKYTVEPRNFNQPVWIEFNLPEDADLDDNNVDVQLSVEGGPEAKAVVHILDQNTKQIVVEPSPLRMREGESQDVRVRLSHPPLERGHIVVENPWPDALELSVDELEVTPETGDQAQTVRVTAVRDLDAVENRYSLRFSMKEAALKAEIPKTQVLPVTVEDVDTTGVRCTPARVAMKEGEVERVRCNFSTPPSRVESRDPGVDVQAAGENAWDIRALADADSADIHTVIRFQSASGVLLLPVDVEDTTVPSFKLQVPVCSRNNTITGRCLPIQENGPEGEFFVTLDHSPGDGVIELEAVAERPDVLRVRPPVLRFDRDNYNKPQRVGVYGYNDPDNQRAVSTVEVRARAGDQVHTENVQVKIFDDDLAIPGSGEFFFDNHDDSKRLVYYGGDSSVHQSIGYNQSFFGLVAQQGQDILFLKLSADFTTYRDPHGDDPGDPGFPAREWLKIGDAVTDGRVPSTMVAPRHEGLAVLVTTAGGPSVSQISVMGDQAATENQQFIGPASASETTLELDPLGGGATAYVNDGAIQLQNWDSSSPMNRITPESSIAPVRPENGSPVGPNLVYLSDTDEYLLFYGVQLEHSSRVYCERHAARDMSRLTEPKEIPIRALDGRIRTAFDGSRVAMAFRYDDPEDREEFEGWAHVAMVDRNCDLAFTHKVGSRVNPLTKPVKPPQLVYNGFEYSLTFPFAYEDPRHPEEETHIRTMRLNQDLMTKDSFNFGGGMTGPGASTWVGGEFFVQYRVVRLRPETGVPYDVMRVATGGFQTITRDGEWTSAAHTVETGADCNSLGQGQGCPVESFAFTNTEGDDLREDDLANFIRGLRKATVVNGGLGTEMSDWIYISVELPNRQGGSYCLPKASWYLDQLVWGASAKGTFTEPFVWPHFYRAQEATDWVKEEGSVATTRYGDACRGEYSWCLPKLGATPALELAPGATGAEELMFNGKPGVGAQVTVRVGADQFVACGMQIEL